MPTTEKSLDLTRIHSLPQLTTVLSEQLTLADIILSPEVWANVLLFLIHIAQKASFSEKVFVSLIRQDHHPELDKLEDQTLVTLFEELGALGILVRKNQVARFAEPVLQLAQVFV